MSTLDSTMSMSSSEAFEMTAEKMESVDKLPSQRPLETNRELMVHVINVASPLEFYVLRWKDFE